MLRILIKINFEKKVVIIFFKSISENLRGYI